MALLILLKIPSKLEAVMYITILFSKCRSKCIASLDVNGEKCSRFVSFYFRFVRSKPLKIIAVELCFVSVCNYIPEERSAKFDYFAANVILNNNK